MKMSPSMCALLVLALGITPAWASDDAEAIKEIRMASNGAIARHDVDALQSFLDNEANRLNARASCPRIRTRAAGPEPYYGRCDAS
jgi:hypothetical protein